jgi:hypothetical protein
MPINYDSDSDDSFFKPTGKSPVQLSGEETLKYILDMKKKKTKTTKKPKKKEPESSSESESDTEVNPAIKKRRDLIMKLQKNKSKYDKPKYEAIYRAILGDLVTSEKDFDKIEGRENKAKTQKINTIKTINNLEQKAIKEIDDFLFVELDKIQKIDSGKKQLSETEIKKIIGEYKKIKTKIDKVVKKIFKNDMKGKGIPKDLGDLIHIDIGSHNTKGEGIKGKGSILGNIGMAYGNAWNQKAIKGSPEDKFLKFFHNDFIPTAMKPIDVLAPPVGELGHAGFDALKEHQGYGLKSRRGKGVQGFNDAQKSYLMDFALSKAIQPQFQSRVMSALTPSEETKTFLTDYTAKKISGQGRGRGRPRKNTGLGYKP